MTLAAALLSGGVLTAAAAHAADTVFPSPGEYRGITPTNSQWNFADKNGDGSINVAFEKDPLRIFMRYQLSDSLIRICVPGSLDETLDLFKKSSANSSFKKVLHDSHRNERCNYNVHPTYMQGDTSLYRMQVKMNFDVVVNGRKGTAEVVATAQFKPSYV